MATGLPILTRGSDEIIEIQLLDDSSNPINPTSCADIEVSVYQNRNDVLQGFKLSDSDVTIYNASTGLIHVKLDRANTEHVPIKRLYVEVALSFTDLDFEDNVQIQKVTDIPLADLKNSVTV